MIRYVLQRLGGAVVVLVVVSSAVFWLFEILPGDAAETTLAQAGRSGAIDPEQLAVVRTRLGLDRGPVERFLAWGGGLLHGDLGTSLLSGRPVADVLGSRIGNSMLLAVVTVALLVPLVTVLGVVAGTHAGSRTDRAVAVTTLALAAVPTFVVGIVLIAVVAVGWRLLPAVSLPPQGAGPVGLARVLVLPVLTLLVALAPHPLRIVRARAAELAGSEAVRTAAAHGVGHVRLLTRYVAPAAVAAALPPLAGSIAGLVGGVAVVETVFGYPGLAQELVRAVALRDFPVVAAAAVLMALFGVAVHLAADLLALLLSPAARRATTAARR